MTCAQGAEGLLCVIHRTNQGFDSLSFSSSVMSESYCPCLGCFIEQFFLSRLVSKMMTVPSLGGSIGQEEAAADDELTCGLGITQGSTFK
ncbi:hypothetical protein ElyMa_001750800 [Elysia marginata]|uniref:Uncharacterized protein n=1 Tax=Elysia marginata TaxID=1093978 RepID=A0AAV4EAG9_9GAST|nr:hypothetical protein ElyMa_001750800 [Elysia marginata]